MTTAAEAEGWGADRTGVATVEISPVGCGTTDIATSVAGAGGKLAGEGGKLAVEQPTASTNHVTAAGAPPLMSLPKTRQQ